MIIRTANLPLHLRPTAHIEALYAAWDASADKGAFMASLSLSEAHDLLDVIVQRVPKQYNGKRRKVVVCVEVFTEVN